MKLACRSPVSFFRSALYVSMFAELISSVPESMNFAVYGVVMNGASAFTEQPSAKRSTA